MVPFTSRIELTVLGGRVPNYRRLAIFAASLCLRHDLHGSRVAAEWLHAKPCLRLVILRNLVVADLDTKRISDSGLAIDSLGNALQLLFSNVERGALDNSVVSATVRPLFFLRIFRRDVLLTCGITSLQHHSTSCQQYLVCFVIYLPLDVV